MLNKKARVKIWESQSDLLERAMPPVAAVAAATSAAVVKVITVALVDQRMRGNKG